MHPIALLTIYLISSTDGSSNDSFKTRNFDELVLAREHFRDGTDQSVLLINRANEEEERFVEESERHKCGGCLIKTFLLKFKLDYFTEDEDFREVQVRLGPGLDAFRDITGRRFKTTATLMPSCVNFVRVEDEPFCWRGGVRHEFEQTVSPLDAKFEFTHILRYWKKINPSQFRYIQLQYRLSEEDEQVYQNEYRTDQHSQSLEQLSRNKFQPTLAIYRTEIRFVSGTSGNEGYRFES